MEWVDEMGEYVTDNAILKVIENGEELTVRNVLIEIKATLVKLNENIKRDGLQSALNGI